MTKDKLLIYGCNGFTGQLISREAIAKGLTPILAGRNEAQVKSLAAELALEFKIFDINDSASIVVALQDVKVVLHCAGPFMYTALPMAKACIETGTHYLDITGEIGVFESLKALDAAAQKANIIVMPGVGFDVVPTDCMSLYLKQQMPDATQLELCLMSKGGRLSHGTAITITENLGEGSAIRKNGKITVTKNGATTREIDFGFTKKTAVEIPWGDVSTAYFTTKIPNIRVYNVLPAAMIKTMRTSNYIAPLLKMRWVKNYLIKKIKAKPAGPSETERNEAQSFVWGEVKNNNGETKSALLELPEGYLLTAQTAVSIAKKIFQSTDNKSGYQTPAALFGADFILNFEKVKRKDL
jgi:short subunit dehydrogenase-like uncharacterized protein